MDGVRRLAVVWALCVFAAASVAGAAETAPAGAKAPKVGKANGSVTAPAGKVMYKCPMVAHPRLYDKPGTCEICGMKLWEVVVGEQGPASSTAPAGAEAPKVGKPNAGVTAPAGKVMYKCPMNEHPRLYDKPGECKLCGMTLIKVVVGEKGPASSTAPAGAAKAAAPAGANGAESAVVTAEPLKVAVAVQGVFAPGKATEVHWAPKSGAALKVVSVAAPGATVKKGQVLVTLDTTELDRRIGDLETGVGLADIALKQATDELKELETTTPEQLAWARRAAKITEDDFKYYKESDVAYNERQLKLDEEGTEISLETAKSEVAELKRMYGADDLWEPTEKLVLRREQHQLDRTILEHERRTKFLFPHKKVTDKREMEEQEKRLEDSKRGLAQAELMIPLNLERQRLVLKKLTADCESGKRMLAEAQEDRKAAAVTAPADGVLYYGRCVRGAWPGAAEMAARLAPGTVLAGEAYFTVVEPEELTVRAEVAERDLHYLTKGMPATVAPTGWPDRKLKGKVSVVSIAPTGPQPYAVEIEVSGDVEKLMPGMTCSVTLRVCEEKAALMVPAGAVFEDPADADRSVVYVVVDGKVKKRVVEVGYRSGEKVQIVKGVKKGDVVMLKEPGE